MKVVHVDTGREWRGGQVQLWHLLRARRDDVLVVPPDAPLRAAAEALGVQVVPIAMRGLPLGTLAVRKEVVQHRADLVAAHTANAHGHLIGIPCPLIVHRRVDFTVNGRWSRWKYAQPTGYVAVSHAVARVLLAGGVASERIRVVHDGVDMQPWRIPTEPGAGERLGVPRGVPWVAAVGALVDHKGHEVLLDALQELPDVHLVVAGDGPNRRALELRAKPLGDRVHWLGQRDDVAAWLGGADVFVHPSHEEGLGQVVIEAMAAGVPVVSTTAGGLPEIVGSDGTLVRPGDPNALATALAAVLADPKARERAVAAAPRIWHNFDVSTMVSETEAAWNVLVGR